MIRRQDILESALNEVLKRFKKVEITSATYNTNTKSFEVLARTDAAVTKRPEPEVVATKEAVSEGKSITEAGEK